MRTPAALDGMYTDFLPQETHEKTSTYRNLSSI